MTEIMNTDSLRIVGIDPVPSYFQFYEGDKIIKIGRDCSLELGTGWSDHNEAATEFFNVVVGDVMPRWKQQERMEERAAIVAWLRGFATNKTDELANILEAGEGI